MLQEWDQVVNNKRGALNGPIMADYQKAKALAEDAFNKSIQTISL